MNRFDELRQTYPHLGFAVYCLEPGDAVTFQVYLPNGEDRTWTANTLSAALDLAFDPVEPEPSDEPPAKPESAFD